MTLKKNIPSLVTLLVVMVFAGLIVWWHLYTPDVELTLQLPGADNRPEGTARRADDVVIGEFFMRFVEWGDGDVHKGISTLDESWPCFRGSDYNNRVEREASINFVADFSVQWNVDTGEGHAAPAIHRGLVYLLDYDEQMSSDMLRCFDLKSGTEIWRRWYRVPLKRNHGFSRTVPAVTDLYVVTIGPQGHVMCCHPISGDLLWSIDVQKEFETQVPFWYAGQCPRIENNRLILAPAGEKTLMAGIDCATGKTVWETPNTVGIKMSHSSIMPMVLSGKKTYVYAGIGGVCGISAENADKGALLWSIDKWKASVVAPSPLQLTSTQIALTAGYGAGGALLQVTHSGGLWTATLLDQYKPSEGLACEQQTPLLYNQMVITVLPKDGGGRRNKLVAYSPAQLRLPVWESEADERFGFGPYMIINHHLLALKDDGELYIYQLEAKGMKLIKKQRVMEGIDAWGPMAYADGYLLLRDDHSLYCIKMETG